jgi:CHAT domain-containing protein/Tfp pilus assembly protein PilF
MALNQTFAGGMLAMLVAVSSPLTLLKTASASPQQLAQVAPTTITGQLDENSETIEEEGVTSGFYFTIHPFEGIAGEPVMFEAISEDFDAYIEVISPSRELLGFDHDSGDGSNARLVIELPETGTYQIGVISSVPGEIGSYSLSWRSATASDIALQRANQLNQQVIELYQAGRYSDATPLAEEALAVRQVQLGDNDPAVATSLNNLALLYRAQGRYGKAEPLYQQALAIDRGQFGDSHPDVAISLNNLAGLYQLQGRYGEAEPLYQQALVIFQAQLGNNHPDVATSLSDLAGLYQLQGRYGEAEPLHQQALVIFQAQLGNNHPAVATSLNSLAALYQLQGRYSEAEPLHQQALAIWQEQFGDNHPDVAQSLNNLAVLYRAQGRYGEAETRHLEALDISREQLGERHPNVAQSLNNLAALYQLQGRYGEAEPRFQEALDILREQLGDRHPLVATNINNLAGLYLAQENLPQAIQAFQAGLAIEESNLEITLATLTEAQRQDYAATLLGTTDGAITLSLQAAEAQPLGLTTLLRRKGRLLEAGSSSLQRLRQNLTPEEQVVLDDLVSVQQQLATLTFNPPANLPPEDYRAQLAELETRAAELEKTLAQRSAVFRAESEPVEIATVQAQIPTNGVLVEYARYRPFDAKADRANQWGDPRYAAYLLFHNGDIQAIDLGDAAAIDNAVENFVTLLQDPRADLRATIVREISPEVVEDVTGTLKTLLLDPIAPYIQDRQHLLISPDSELNRLPFEALITDSGEYLVEQYQISYLSSGRDLLKFDVVEPSSEPAVILANPDYESASAPSSVTGERGNQASETSASRSSTDMGRLTVTPLPGTAEEVAAIAPLLPGATILTEANATENALKQAQKPSILHIATHGFFLADAPRPEPADNRGLIASSDGFRAFGTVSAPIENPLLRSGLALAGFNTRSSGNEDGVFTALEAANLNLYGTQLVVLSACDTGLGDINNGEGVYGLRRAFALAGAETQLLSLWQVSDYGTQSLMARYYENLMAGLGRSEALRAVQLEMIREGGEYAHPYYWSAFILAGDWRPLDAPSN